MAEKINKGIVVASENNYFVNVYEIKGDCSKEQFLPLRVLYTHSRQKLRTDFYRLCWFDKRPVRDATIETLLRVIEKKIPYKEVKADLLGEGIVKFTRKWTRCVDGRAVGIHPFRATSKYFVIDKTWKKVFHLEECPAERWICGEGDLAGHAIRIITERTLVEWIQKGYLNDYVLPRDFFGIKYKYLS